MISVPNEELKDGRIGIELDRIEPNLSIVGQVDQNLLSFVTNVLIEHNVKSIIMVKKTDISKEVDSKEDIFVYKPSRAEREFLERD